MSYRTALLVGFLVMVLTSSTGVPLTAHQSLDPKWLHPKRPTTASRSWAQKSCNVCPHVTQAFRQVLPCPGEVPFNIDDSVLHYGEACAFSGSCDAFGSPAVRQACRNLLAKLYHPTTGILMKSKTRDALHEALFVKPQAANPLPEYEFQMDKYLSQQAYDFCATEVTATDSSVLSPTHACVKRSTQPPEDEEGSPLARSCEGILTGHMHGCRDDPFCGEAVADDAHNPKKSGLCSPECFSCYWLIRTAPMFRCDDPNYRRLHASDCGIGKFSLKDALQLWFQLLRSPKARYFSSAVEDFSGFPWSPHMACRCIGICQSDTLEQLSTEDYCYYDEIPARTASLFPELTHYSRHVNEPSRISEEEFLLQSGIRSDAGSDDHFINEDSLESVFERQATRNSDAFY